MAELTLQELDHRLTLIEGWKEAQEKVFLGFKDDLQEIKQRITCNCSISCGNRIDTDQNTVGTTLVVVRNRGQG